MTGDPPELHEQLEQLWRDLEKIDGDDSAAREHLAAGRAIYIADDDTPPGLLIKKYPDGRPSRNTAPGAPVPSENLSYDPFSNTAGAAHPRRCVRRWRRRSQQRARSACPSQDRFVGERRR